MSFNLDRYISLGSQQFELYVEKSKGNKPEVKWVEGYDQETERMVREIVKNSLSEPGLVGALKQCGFEVYSGQENFPGIEKVQQTAKTITSDYGPKETSALIHFFGQIEGIQLTKLHGGSGNRIYKVEQAGEGPLILRIWKEEAHPFSVKKNEEMSALALRYKFGPGLIKQKGFEASLLEYAEGGEVTPNILKNSDILKGVARSLKKLHSVPVDELSPLVKDERRSPPIFEKVQRIYEEGLKRNAHYPKIVNEILKGDVFKKLRVGIKGDRLGLCHIDGHHLNMLLDSKNGIALIDFDDAAISDPFYDLANFSTQAFLSDKQDLILLEEYLGRKPNQEELEDLSIYKKVAALRLAVWAFKEASGKSGLEDLNNVKDLSNYGLTNGEIEDFKNNKLHLEDPGYIRRIGVTFLLKFNEL